MRNPLKLFQFPYTTNLALFLGPKSYPKLAINGINPIIQINPRY